MANKKYPTMADYEAAEKSTTESTVSRVTEGNEVEYDGVNVNTTDPQVGDALYLDVDGSKVFIVGTTLNASLIPSRWTHVGEVFMREGFVVGVLNKTGDDRKYADVVQFQLNAPTLDGEEHTATIGVRVTGGTSAGYGSNTTITYTYTATTLADVVTALNEAIDAAQASLKFTNVLWAYMADDDGNKVDDAAEATKIIVQLDTWNDYRQYQCAGMAHITWGDMPANTNYLKTNGKNTEYRGLMNFDRGYAYWSASGRTPTANEPIGAAGNTDPVNKTAFDSSEYCATIREAYGDYMTYLKKEFGIQFPQKYASFALPDGKTLCAKYAMLLAPTKAGSTKAKFPAMNYASMTQYDSDGLRLGDWFLPGIREGLFEMNDDTLTKVSATQTKVGGTTILNNSTHRWFAQRCNVYSARLFYGTNGTLNDHHVNSTSRAQAVALLNIKP